MKIGFLHPGEMGISLAASALNSGHEACWAAEGRSGATAGRARQHGLTAFDTVAELCGACEILVAVCPPHAAAQQAAEVRSAGFQGIYVDANAISPQSVITIGEEMQRAGISFVDGGIVGMPAWKPNATWFYLSGIGAEQVAGCFREGPLETEVLGTETGKASALKMCFAANTKGTTALLSAILGTAERLGVREALENQWERYHPGMAGRTHERIRTSARKAWRFTGEMEEIADTFEAAGMPPGFHRGARDIFRRQRRFKDANEPPALEDILEALLNESGKP